MKKDIDGILERMAMGTNTFEDDQTVLAYIRMLQIKNRKLESALTEVQSGSAPGSTQTDSVDTAIVGSTYLFCGVG